jgi:hypothetical protein
MGLFEPRPDEVAALKATFTEEQVIIKRSKIDSILTYVNWLAVLTRVFSSSTDESTGESLNTKQGMVLLISTLTPPATVLDGDAPLLLPENY